MSVSIWPLYFIINELPYSHRYKRENIILAGLWFGPKKPVVNLFLSVFRDSLKKLYKGIRFELPNRIGSVLVKGIVMCGTCDLSAKAHFLNMKQYNGNYGCHNYKQKGEQIDHTHVYPYTDRIDMRTTNEILQFAN